MSTKLKWGILGTGNIANQFAEGVAGSQRSVVTAAGSRSQGSADAFAGKHGVASACASYDGVLSDPEVDAVYISLPNHLHKEWSIKALEAGKHVLCEKPFGMDAAEAEEMFDVSEKQGKLLVEAFMYRSHPLTHKVLEIVRSGRIGEVKLIRTSFCYCTNKIDGNVRFDRSIGGGALMDIGCYCLSFTRLIAGAEPTSVHCLAHMHETGVDDLCSGVMLFPSGVAGEFTCGMTLQADNTAYISGSDGYIAIPIPWKPPVTGAQYRVAGMTPPKMDGGKKGPPPNEDGAVDAPGPLYGLEADDFAAAVLDGVAPAVSKADTLGNMRLLDECRTQIGLSWA